MTIAEKLLVHEEIEKESRKHFRRWKLMNLYHEMIWSGKMYEAREVLRLLRRGRITLGLDDISWNVQTALEDVSYPVSFSRDGNKAYVCA